MAGDIVQVRSDLEREVPTGIDTGSIVDGDTQFPLDLFRELAADGPDSNLFVSPYSISVALAMTLTGAKGDTWDEMASMLRATEGDQWHEGRNALDRHLLRERPTFDERDPLTLEIANSLWGQNGYPFQTPFLDLMARHYGSGLIGIDFQSDPDGARQAINQWVEDATNERIVDLLPDGSIDSLVRLVLVNAIYFHANWATQFNEGATEDGSFTTATGTEVAVPLMHGSMTGDFSAGDGWTAARLPYAGDASMLVVLPDEGRWTDVAGALDAARLAEIRSAFQPAEINVTMPKFEFTTEVTLNPYLAALGMVQAFSRGSADLSGIADVEQIYVSLVQHQAFVSVDEHGTEAAAATAIVARALSMGPPPQTLVLDRPFVFLIVDDDTGAILFAGQVTDPTAG